MIRTIKRRRLRLTDLDFYLLVFLYRALLDWAYIHIVSKHYSYVGFVRDSEGGLVLTSWCFLLALALMTKKYYINRTQKISYEILFALFLFSVVPFSSLMANGNCDRAYLVANTVFYLLLYTLVGVNSLKTSRVRLSLGKNSSWGESLLIIIALVSFFVVFYISGRYTGFRLSLNLTEVYEFRAEARTYGLPKILAYLFSWSRMINPIIVAYFIRRRKWLWAAVGIGSQILSFGIDGSKTPLFLLATVLAVNCIPNLGIKTLNRAILCAFVLISAVSIFSYTSRSNLTLASLFIRRTLFVPAKLGSWYYDFFTTHVPDYFRQSFLRHLGLSSPYPTIPNMIGSIYMKRDTYANNGLIADAVTNMGIAGVAVLPFFLAFILRMLDRSNEGIDPRIYISVAIYVAQEMVNTFVLPLLLSHGLLVIMLLLIMMKRNPDNTLGIRAR